jgi:hypothetical protein
MQVRFLPSNVVPGAVVHTRQRDETENDRDISRIVEIPATLAEIWRKTVFHKRRIFDHFQDDECSIAITVRVKPSRQDGVVGSPEGLMPQARLCV